MSEEKKAPFSTQASNEAMKRLREAHRDEYEAIVDAIYAEADMKRRRRLSTEERAKKVAEEKAAKAAAKARAAREKAQAALDALLATYPDLQPTSVLKSVADGVA